MSNRLAAFDKLNELESILNGSDVQRIPHELLFRTIEKSDGLCMIYFKRDGDNVRAVKGTSHLEKVIGIPNDELEGYLLTDFVKIDPLDVLKSIEYVNENGFMVKYMMLSRNLIPTQALIIRVGEDQYIEIIWRLSDVME